MDIVHVFSDDAVGSAECAHAHLLDDGSPIVQVCIEKDGIGRTFPVEPQISNVGKNQSTLSCLVEVELHDLWPVLGSPETVDFSDRVRGDAAFTVLLDQKVVRAETDHDLHVRVQLGLCRGIQGDAGCLVRRNR